MKDFYVGIEFIEILIFRGGKEIIEKKIKIKNLKKILDFLIFG